MTRWTMVADLRRCVGCQTCTAACKHANATPPGVQWRRVLDMEFGEAARFGGGGGVVHLVLEILEAGLEGVELGEDGFVGGGDVGHGDIVRRLRLPQWKRSEKKE